MKFEEYTVIYTKISNISETHIAGRASKDNVGGDGEKSISPSQQCLYCLGEVYITLGAFPYREGGNCLPVVMEVSTRTYTALSNRL